MNVVNYPKLGEINEEYNEEYIVDLYKAIGWGSGDDVDPKRIAMNKEQWLEVCKEFNKLEGFGAIPGYVWMNYGPTVSEDVPYGKLKIYKGAFTLRQSS